MQQLIEDGTDGRGITRRQLMRLGVLGMAGWLVPFTGEAAAALEYDLADISNLVQGEKRDGPLLTFRDFVPDADVEVERHIRDQLSRRKDLLTALKQKIGFQRHVRLSVEDIRVRLMFVPQRQAGAAAAYHRYCLSVTDFLFEMGHGENVFAAVTSPTRSYPPISQRGVSAFLVHRLAKDYQAVCRFTADSGQRVKYKVSGAIFSNHLGAVDLNIELLAEGRFGLTRSPFTIWQNDGDGIATLMAVPIEESLHYWLGGATDRQIRDAIDSNPPKSLAEAKQLAQAWMAIEESVVGGVVEQVLDRYCAEHHMQLPASVGAEMHSALSSLDQYRYRRQGILLARKLGFQETMAMYLDSPAGYKARLLRSAQA